ncbi:MAG TPA: hypothetical protein VFD72_00940 [Sphingobacteriaceae bacterium]|nr:hypothetical protein [Sphingobacteriaceae bacterium]
MPRLPETFRNAVKLDRNLIYELIEQKNHPCFTLMMPTHGVPPERDNDPLQFKNLVSELEAKIKANGLDKHLNMISKLHSVEEDRDFWNHQSQGLAVFIHPEYLKVVRVQVPLPALTIVSDTFHVKPLYRYYQESGRFQVLVLGQDHVQLYEGNRYKLEEVDLEGKVPVSMKEGLGHELTDDHYNTATASGKGTNKQANQGTGHVVHGYMEISQEKDNDIRRFFNLVDEEITLHFSRPSGLPLILAALPENEAYFREVSKNEYLIPTGISGDVRFLDRNALKERAWEAYSVPYHQEIDEILERQALAETQHLSHSLLEDVALDAIDGKVDVLLVEEKRIIKGKVDQEHRRIEYLDSGVDDVLDDLSALVIEKSGRVILLPAEKMPHAGGAVSINRF